MTMRGSGKLSMNASSAAEGKFPDVLDMISISICRKWQKRCDTGSAAAALRPAKRALWQDHGR